MTIEKSHKAYFRMHILPRLKFLLVFLMLPGLSFDLFALRIVERNRPVKNNPEIINREVTAVNSHGFGHGFAVTYRMKDGTSSALDSQGFRLGYCPTGNWYQGGFFNSIVVDGKRITLRKSKYPEVVRVLSNTAEKTVLGAVFETEAGDFQITMTVFKEKYYSYVKFEFLKPVKSFDISFLNHPEHYNKQKMARVLRSAEKTFEMGEKRTISGKNQNGWMLYEDKFPGSFGPSAIMYQPEYTTSVSYSIHAGYVVTTNVKMNPNRNSAHFLFWHFPAKQFPRNLPYDYLKNKGSELLKELRSFAASKKSDSTAASDPVTFYEMKKLSKAPVLDGKMESSVWENVPWSGSFCYLGTRDKAMPETNFKLAYDDQNLYFFVKCSEPDIKSMISTGKKHDFNIGDDDYVEFFICPYGELDDYFQFIINSNGAVWDSRVKKALRDVSWNSNAVVKAAKGKNEWTLEGKIPVRGMVKPEKKTLSVWLFNASRQRTASATKENTGLKWTTWSKLPVANFNTPSAFNVLSGIDASYSNMPTAFMASDNYKDLYLQKHPIQCSFPREELFIANNLYAPNFIKIKDQRYKYKNYLAGSGKYRKLDEWKQYLDTLKIHVRVPEGCSLLTGETGYRSVFHVKQAGKNHYIVSPIRLDSGNTLYKLTHCHFDSTALFMTSTLPAGSRGEIEIWIEQQIKKEKLVTGITKYPFTVIQFPEVRQLKRFVINMWPDLFSLFIPDYAKKVKALGFNSIPVRWDWVEYNHKRYPGKSQKLENHIRKMVKDARDNGMMVCVHDSTMGEFYGSKQGRWGNTKYMDPGYTGPVYQKEISDIKEIAEEVNPDHLFIDCEYFAHHGQFTQEAIYSWKEGKKRIGDSGLSLKGYLSSCGDRLAGDVKKALHQPGKKRIQVGFYGTGGCFYLPKVRFPGREMFDLIFNIHTLLDKKLVDYAMPSPYHSGEIDDRFILCFSELRKNIKNGPILPWAAAGYPVPFNKEMVRDQFLEMCAFGCVGVAYFAENVWDVGAYWYQAKAINEIAPFEDIVMDGTFYEQTKKAYKNAHIKGMRKGSEAIILFSCYKRYKNITESVQNPLPEDCEVYDAVSGKKIGNVKKGGSVAVELDMSRNTKLLYFGTQWKKRK